MHAGRTPANTCDMQDELALVGGLLPAVHRRWKPTLTSAPARAQHLTANLRASRPKDWLRAVRFGQSQLIKDKDVTGQILTSHGPFMRVEAHILGGVVISPGPRCHVERHGSMPCLPAPQMLALSARSAGAQPSLAVVLQTQLRADQFGHMCEGWPPLRHGGRSDPYALDSQHEA